jgi:DNA (cytosine-5)-methyltransferase 1
LTHIGLFEGIGGFSEAAKKVGWETIAWCEIDEFCQLVLKDLYPNAKTHSDIKTTDFTIYRGKCDILTGGFPCQPYSVAGRREGKDDERHLWPEMRRAIREVQPTWVVGENVPGIINWNAGLVFEEVQTDLEAQGYEVLTFILPSAGVDAPHRRDRVWFVAYSDNNGFQSGRFKQNRPETPKAKRKKNKWQRIWNDIRRNGEQKTVSYPTIERRKEWFESKRPKNKKEIGKKIQFWIKRFGRNELATYTDITKSQRSVFFRSFRKERAAEKERRQFSGPFFCFWENFPTQSPICNGDDGFSTQLLRQRIREDSMGYLSEKEINKIFSRAYIKWRREVIKAGGNAIVNQVAVQIFKAIIIFTNLK